MVNSTASSILGTKGPASFPRNHNRAAFHAVHFRLSTCQQILRTYRVRTTYPAEGLTSGEVIQAAHHKSLSQVLHVVVLSLLPDPL